jgi:glutamine amidotransferase
VSAERPQIGVVDYGMGNRRSVQKAFEHVGASAPITSDRDGLDRCAALVIPGVGAFPRGMENLKSLGLDTYIRSRAEQGTPVLGICLGMHLLFDSSVELQATEGLGLIPGEVTWLSPGQLRLPHIGWNEVRFERPIPLLDGLPEAGCPFYHVHSLAPRPAEAETIVATTEYGERFATIVQRANVSGVQFHPEKSSGHGLRLLANFVARCTAAPAAAPDLARPAA